MIEKVKTIGFSPDYVKKPPDCFELL